MKQLLFSLVVAFILPIVGASGAVGHSARTLYFGIVPQQSASKLARVWGPVAEYLSAETGLTIEFATVKDIPTFEKCLAKGMYQIAYMNPYHYTTFHKAAGYDAFAHQKGKKLKGLLVVRKDSDIERLEQLSGQELAFPSPAAFGASILTRAELKRQGVDFTPNYVRSHDSVFRSVAAGFFPAGGAVLRTLGKTDPEVRDQLKVLYTTQAYTPHAFAFSAALDEEKRQLVRKAFLSMEEKAPDLLKALGIKGLDEASDASWDDVRALHLDEDHTQISMDGDVSCHSD